MGWKAVKDYYKIKHIAHIINGQFVIGSPMSPRIFVFSPKGDFLGQSEGTINIDLIRYKTEILTDVNKFVELFQSEDKFDQDIPVWFYRDGKVSIDHCENFGWPNVTHSGQLMYINAEFHKSEEEAIRASLENALSCWETVNTYSQRLKEDRQRFLDTEFRVIELELISYRISARFGFLRNISVPWAIGFWRFRLACLLNSDGRFIGLVPFVLPQIKKKNLG